MNTSPNDPHGSSPPGLTHEEKKGFVKRHPWWTTAIAVIAVLGFFHATSSFSFDLNKVIGKGAALMDVHRDGDKTVMNTKMASGLGLVGEANAQDKKSAPEVVVKKDGARRNLVEEANKVAYAYLEECKSDTTSPAYDMMGLGVPDKKGELKPFRGSASQLQTQQMIRCTDETLTNNLTVASTASEKAAVMLAAKSAEQEDAAYGRHLRNSVVASLQNAISLITGARDNNVDADVAGTKTADDLKKKAASLTAEIEVLNRQVQGEALLNRGPAKFNFVVADNVGTNTPDVLNPKTGEKMPLRVYYTRHGCFFQKVHQGRIARYAVVANSVDGHYGVAVMNLSMIRPMAHDGETAYLEVDSNTLSVSGLGLDGAVRFLKEAQQGCSKKYRMTDDDIKHVLAFGRG